MEIKHTDEKIKTATSRSDEIAHTSSNASFPFYCQSIRTCCSLAVDTITIVNNVVEFNRITGCHIGYGFS
jgi:hypothetical protein